MLEMIHENHLRTQELKKMIIEEKRKTNEIKETIILTLCGLALVVLIIMNHISTNENIKNCVKKGYTENYCISQLG